MRALRTIAIIPVATLLLMACGSDSNSTAGSAVDTAVDTVADTTLAVEATTLPPADTTPATALDGPVQIDVLVGTDSGPDRVETVKVGSAITLNLTNPDAADEFHVHTIELEQAVDAGVTATFNFVADTPGTYEVESHVTEEVLVVIEVV